MGSSLVFSLALRALPYAGMAALAGWLYLQGQHAAERKAELASARNTISVLHENNRRSEYAGVLASQAAKRRAVNEQNLQMKVDAYEDERKALGDRASCVPTDAELDGLYDIK